MTSNNGHQTSIVRQSALFSGAGRNAAWRGCSGPGRAATGDSGHETLCWSSRVYWGRRQNGGIGAASGVWQRRLKDEPEARAEKSTWPHGRNAAASTVPCTPGHCPSPASPLEHRSRLGDERSHRLFLADLPQAGPNKELAQFRGPTSASITNHHEASFPMQLGHRRAWRSAAPRGVLSPRDQSSRPLYLPPHLPN